jgi:hypothetical protein
MSTGENSLGSYEWVGRTGPSEAQGAAAQQEGSRARRPGFRADEVIQEGLRTTPADIAEWAPIFVQVSKQLRGTVFTPALFDKVVAIADNPLAK